MIGFIYICEPPPPVRVGCVRQRLAGKAIFGYNAHFLPGMPVLTTHWNTPANYANDNDTGLLSWQITESVLPNTTD